MVDGEHRDRGTVSRRRGRHAAPGVTGGASAHGLRARILAFLAAGLAWLFERGPRVVILAVTVVVVAVLGGAITTMSFAGAPPALDARADVASTSRPTSTDPAGPTSYAPLLPSPGSPPSVGAPGPASPQEDVAHPATDVPADPEAEPTAEPAPIAQPGRETAPAPTNLPDASSPPGETTAPADPEDPEDCVEQRVFLELLLFGPSCP